MPLLSRILSAATAALLVLGAGCATAGRSGSSRDSAPIGIPALKHTPADAHFMTGMIHHHAQAVVIAKWAPTHGASAELQRLAERIVVSQNDEILLMQNWLKDKGEPVPAASPGPMRMKLNGMEHDMLMPGMMTEADLKQLDTMRGVEFDKLFLSFMIRHHEGALDMVDTLFESPGAGQDETVFRFASDVFADQTTEIRVMTQMLEARSREVEK
ncbi:MAG: DUF305 domain-containing protein [Gemmatimonas sp.]